MFFLRLYDLWKLAAFVLKRRGTIPLSEVDEAPLFMTCTCQFQPFIDIFNICTYVLKINKLLSYTIII